MSFNGNGRRRVVITGLGAVSPLGNDAETSWQNLLAGESGAGPITHFDSSDFTVHFACQLEDFAPAQWIERKQARPMDRLAQMIVSAAGPRQRSTRSASPASGRCAPSRDATTIRSGGAGPSMRSATGS